MRILPILLMLVVWAAVPVRAEQDPLALADPTHREAADKGDPYAIYAYLMPILSLERPTEAQVRAMAPYLFRAYVAFLREEPEAKVQFNAALAARQIAIGHQRLSELADAVRWQKACLRLTEAAEQDSEAQLTHAFCLEDLAITYDDLSRYAEAIEAVRKARGILASRAAGPGALRLDIANTYLNEGTALDGLEKFEEAIAIYKRALEIYEAAGPEQARLQGYLANNIAVSHWKLEEFEKAEAWLKRALPLIVAEDGPASDTAARVQMNLGIIVFETGRVDEAISWGMKAMPYFSANRQQSLGDQRWLFDLFRRAFAARGETERAIFFGKMAVNAQQEIRALNADLASEETADLRREWRKLYEGLAELLIREGRISEAQAVLNMEKEQEVFEFLKRDGKADLRKSRAILNDRELGEEEKLAQLAEMPVAAARALQEVVHKMNNGTATTRDEDQFILLQDALFEAHDAFDTAVEAFLASVPEAERETFEQQFDATGTYQAILEGLERPTAILQAVSLEEGLHLFLTLPGLTLHETVETPRAEVARAVFDALQDIENRAPGAKERLMDLHALLYAPLEEALESAGTEVVMLNLDGFLRYVPFAALYDGERYLVERHAFVLYSPAKETQFAKPTRKPERSAGFGVTKGHGAFSPLPGVAEELETIFHGGDGRGVLAGRSEMDEKFNLRALRLGLARRPEILHIASHFALRPGQEDDSFLLMGDGSHLPLARIRSDRNLYFRGVDLLTLSACQTARGGDGSEIDGFAATAQLSGASAVLASLWPVADAATPLLMRDFYDNLLVQGMDKAEALRRAQIRMLSGEATTEGEIVLAERAAAALDEAGEAAPEAGFAHPYFWSAFVLMGNWL